MFVAGSVAGQDRTAQQSTIMSRYALLTSPDTLDILIKGGHVIDPKNGVDGIRDVGIAAVDGSPRLPGILIPRTRSRWWMPPVST